MTAADNIPLPAFQRNAITKILIVAVEGFRGAIEAQYNPHTVQIDKTVTWKDSGDYLAYDKTQCRTITLELLFDVMELQRRANRLPLAAVLDTLTKMTQPTDRKGKDPDRRPPVLKIGNGPIPGLLCVMESLSIKVTAYHPVAHEPVRATVNIKLREVSWDAERRKIGSGAAAMMSRASGPAEMETASPRQMGIDDEGTSIPEENERAAQARKREAVRTGQDRQLETRDQKQQQQDAYRKLDLE